jgi:hypothetical protein
VVIGIVYWLVPPAPVDRIAGNVPMKMHVAEIVPTDAAFHEPVRAFRGNAAYWRISIRDAQDQPVTAARVSVNVVGPDGVVRARPMMVTSDDGLARFTCPLTDADLPGIYTLRVVGVSHLIRNVAEYDSAANEAWSNSFSVNKPDRRLH